VGTAVDLDGERIRLAVAIADGFDQPALHAPAIEALVPETAVRLYEDPRQPPGVQVREPALVVAVGVGHVDLGWVGWLGHDECELLRGQVEGEHAALARDHLADLAVMQRSAVDRDRAMHTRAEVDGASVCGPVILA
jgi:hypothetical protein